MTTPNAAIRPRPAEPIEVSEEAGQRRYSLQGRVLKGDEWLELLLYDGSWLPVQFGLPETPEGKPTGCIAIQTRRKSSLPVGILFALPAEALFRWPQSWGVP